MNIHFGLRLWWSACVIAIPVYAWADEPIVLTLDDALALATEQNPSLTAAGATVEEARGDWRDARRLVRNNPKVQVAIPSSANGVAEVQVTQSIGVTGQRFPRARMGRELYEATTAYASDVHRTLELDIAVSFYRALGAEEWLHHASEDAKLARDLLDIATRRVARGTDAPITVELARIRTADSERRHIDAEAQVQVSILHLEATIGIPVAGMTDPEGELPGASALPAIDVMVARAIKARPDVEALEHRVEAAEAGHRLARASSFPALTVGARYEDVGDGNGWVALVGISPPIFNQNSGARIRARATMTRTESELTAVRIEVEANVRAAWERWVAARRIVDVYDADVLAAQDESLRIITRAYEEGKLDFSEVAVVRRERLESLFGNLDARITLAVAEAELRAGAALPINGPVGDLK